MTGRDCWSEWLLWRRFGGDPEVETAILERLRATRDRVLDGAGRVRGETVLDVGCGDGLIAFGALGRGARLAIFSDISPDLLGEARRIAGELGVSGRCRFVRAAADDLSFLRDQSAGIVTTRSVLIYVADKARAFSEFHRVLGPGGRLSIFEPVNRLNRFLRAYDATGVQELDDRVNSVFEALQPGDRDPMLNFDDRDLVDLAESAGFNRVSLTLEVELQPPEPMRWEAYVNMAFNPKIPALREAIQQVLTPEEQQRYESHMRPLVEAGRGSRRMACAYLRAIKDGPAS
jgi:ubiquinone/menaquinone biosynthesis C-methylase UbiE